MDSLKIDNVNVKFMTLVHLKSKKTTIVIV